MSSADPPAPADGDAFAALRRSEALFRGLLESAPDAIVIVNVEGKIVLANGQAEQLFGYTSQELIGQPVELLVPPSLRARHAENMARYRENPGTRPMGSDLDLRALHKDGQELAVEISLGPLVTEGGTLVSAVIRDMSARRRLEQRVALAERLASIGAMAAGLAHEINNPLAAVLANVEFAAEDMTELERVSATSGESALAGRLREVSESLGDAREAGKRVQRIVDDLKRFARTGADTTQRVDLRRAVDAAVKLTAHQVRAKARLVLDRGTTPEVDVNEDGLVQVLTNLLVNASHAIPDEDRESHEVCIRTATDTEGRAVIEVSDTGCGIAPRDLGRVFDPFFTTKPPGVGSGLGLAISHSIISKMRGTLTVESVVGRGTTFRIVLPAATTAKPAPPASPVPAPPTRRARVLIVDDDPIVARATARLLSSEYEVAVENDPRSALETIHTRPPDVILCDLMMPHLSGLQLHASVAARDPRLAERIVFVTGGVPAPDDAALLAALPNPKLSKPFSLHGLRGVLSHYAK